MVPILVTTLGAKGSIIETKTERIEIPIAKVKHAVDPTGAGDAYRAGFVAGYLSKKPLDVCGSMGAVAAAYVVGTYGTMNHFYTSSEFSQRMNVFQKRGHHASI